MKLILIHMSLVVCILFSVTTNSQSQIPSGGIEIIKDPLTYYNKIGKAAISKITVSDQAFASAFSVATSNDVVNPWDAQLGFQVQNGIAQKDILLVAFYARTTVSSDESGTGSVNVCIENKTTYEKVIYQSVNIGTEWKQYFCAIESKVTLLNTNTNCSFHVGFVSQTVEIADIHFLNYGTTKKLEDMPFTEITYVGREPDAAWRAEAQERIDQIRKGNIQLKIVDDAGNPISNAEVKLSMLQHHFKFGSAITANDYMTNQVYKDKILEMFNEVVFENDLKWPTFISKTTEQKNQMTQAFTDLKNHNISVRGHNVVWPSWQFNASYLANYKSNPEKLRMEIDKHIDEVCTFIRGKVVDWDVINEPYSEHDFMDILGREVMADWFKRVRNNDPYVKLYLNDYAILSSNGTNYPKQNSYIETIKYINSLGGGIQGIGFQGHFASDLTPIPRLKTVLDKFSDLGVEIKVTEFDINVTQRQVQADYTRDFYTMLFSHPSVTGILMWGFWESRHWLPEGAMYNADWTIRPNGEAFRDLVLNQWRTKDTTIISDENGVLNFNGFLGIYNYVVKYNGIERTGTIEANKPVSTGIINNFVVSTDPTVPSELKIKVTGDRFLCEGKTTQLAIELANDFNVKWFKGTEELSENGLSIVVNSSGNYYAQASGKGVVLNSDSVIIVVNSLPIVQIDSSGPLGFCPGGEVILSTQKEISYTYRWLKNNTFFAGSLPSAKALESGIYKVEVNSLGCKSLSPEVSVTKFSSNDPRCVSGVNENVSKVTFYPNPFGKSIMLDLSNSISFPVEIEFLDVTGKLMYESRLFSPENTEIVPDLQSGIYFLKFTSAAQNQVFKLICEN